MISRRRMRQSSGRSRQHQPQGSIILSAEFFLIDCDIDGIHGSLIQSLAHPFLTEVVQDVEDGDGCSRVQARRRLWCCLRWQEPNEMLNDYEQPMKVMKNPNFRSAAMTVLRAVVFGLGLVYGI